MKNRVAVVVGALGMFISGYILGYTTAIPDFLRSSVLEIPEGEGPAIDDFVVDITDQARDPGAVSELTNDQANSKEVQELKRMIVPMLTDEEIKKIREEAAAEAAKPKVEVEETAPIPENPESLSGDNPPTENAPTENPPTENPPTETPAPVP